VTSVPLRLDGVGDALIGTRLEECAVRTAVTEAMVGIDPMSDLYCSADYRRRAAVTLAVRAITDAAKAASRGAHVP